MSSLTSTHSFILPAVNSAVDEDLWGAQLNTNFTNLDSYLVTRIANYDFAGFELQNALIKAPAAKTYDLGSVSGALAINYNNGPTQFGVVTGNITSVSVSNWPATGKEGFMTLELQWDGTGGWTFALGSSAYKTVDGAGVTPITSAGAVNEFYIRTRNGGTSMKIDMNRDYH